MWLSSSYMLPNGKEKLLQRDWLIRETGYADSADDVTDISYDLYLCLSPRSATNLLQDKIYKGWKWY